MIKTSRFALFVLVLHAAFLFTSCGKKEGAQPGSDSSAKNSSAPVSAAPQGSAPDNAKFGMKAGIAHGTVERGGSKLNITVYFDDWGNKTCNETIGEANGQAIYQVSITKDGSAWVFDPDKKMGRKLKAKGDDLNFRHMNPDSLKAKGLVEIGKEVFLGKECIVYSMKPKMPELPKPPKGMPGGPQQPPESKFWVWDGFPMKMEMGTLMKMEITKIEDTAPPASKFEVPADIKFSDM